MSGEIVNRVAKSGLITLDLTDYAPAIKVIGFDLKDFLFEGIILKEKQFRLSLKEFNFKQYENTCVAVFCSSDCVIPMWAFMLVASHLNNVAEEIHYGNERAVFEQLFLRNIKNVKHVKFKNKKVIVKGCGQVPLSGALYIEIAKILQNTVDSLMFGEACSAVPIYKKKK